MTIEYINPFVESVTGFFDTMLKCRVRRGELTRSGPTASAETTAIIGLSGPIRGTVAIILPRATATGMVKRLLGTDEAEAEETISDGVAEIVNILAGAAKSKLPNNDGLIELSLPTVIRGADYTVEYPSDSVRLDMPFTSDLGPFTLRLTLQLRQKSLKKEESPQ